MLNKLKAQKFKIEGWKVIAFKIYFEHTILSSSCNMHHILCWDIFMFTCCLLRKLEDICWINNFLCEGHRRKPKTPGRNSRQVDIFRINQISNRTFIAHWTAKHVLISSLSSSLSHYLPIMPWVRDLGKERESWGGAGRNLDPPTVTSLMLSPTLG